MKGQGDVFATALSVAAVGVIILVGLIVYGVSQDQFPHDELFTNESMCTTCVNGTAYVFDNVPIANDTTLVCYNNSAELMTNGINDPTCLGYNALSNRQINITNTSNDHSCQITNVVCTYIQNNADDERQAFYETTNSTIYSGFALAAILGVIIAAGLILAIIFVLRGA